MYKRQFQYRSRKERIGIKPGRTNTTSENLLDFDSGASVFELLLDLFGIFLGNALLEGLRAVVDEVLCFLQTKARDLADDLDDVEMCIRDSSMPLNAAFVASVSRSTIFARNA